MHFFFLNKFIWCYKINPIILYLFTIVLTFLFFEVSGYCVNKNNYTFKIWTTTVMILVTCAGHSPQSCYAW